jgi:hypothetical protein
MVVIDKQFQHAGVVAGLEIWRINVNVTFLPGHFKVLQNRILLSNRLMPRNMAISIRVIATSFSKYVN